MPTRAVSTRLTPEEERAVEDAAAAADATVSAVLREGALRRARELCGETIVLPLELTPGEDRRLRAAASVADVKPESFAREAIGRAVRAKLGAEAATDAVESGMAQATEA